MHVEPRATYRLQLSSRMNFRQVSELIPYLHGLGISHVYFPPLLQATAGSEHGYDVADPTRVNEELGGEEGLQEVFEKLREHEMGAIIDIVPNHLAASLDNPWWRDVLKHGQESAYARFFDIHWNGDEGAGQTRILIPILEDHLTNVLVSGGIEVRQREFEGHSLRYQELELPINQEGEAMIAGGVTDPWEILDVQHYRLSHWRLAPEEINYRRFFAVAELVGVRVEDSDVFEATHRKINELVKAGPVDGLRIDHPDGLRDPAAYLRRLRDQHPGLWIVAEKILEPGEGLPTEWPIDGTTGYDFLQLVGGLWIDPTGEKAITDFCADFTGQSAGYGEVVREQKRRIIESLFAGDVMRLARLLRRIADTRKLDYPVRDLRDLLADAISSFPVYRTYVQPERDEISDADQQCIAEALSACRRRLENRDEGLFDFLGSLLRGGDRSGDALEFLARFQQITGAVMAKGVEDTTFYRFDRLLALNEVGCDPARFGVSPDAFHQSNVAAHEAWPRRMLATSTHDTKRSEDVRCRISLLSEIPVKWADEVRKWSEHNFPAWSGREPDRSAEHLFYQTLVGAWPIEKRRVTDYMRKAYREAGRHTSWTSPNEVYETRIDEFIASVLEDADFLSMLEDFITPLILPGRVNSLSQTLLKLTVPGVPDIYQGCEIWDNSLVDPDNRRDVDFGVRQKLLGRLAGDPSLQGVLAGMENGLPKMHVIRKALDLRRRKPGTFRAGGGGAYRPLVATGSKLSHVLAFSRGDEVAVAVPRLLMSLQGEWEDTSVILGPGKWLNVLDGRIWEGEAAADALFASFPVALFERS